MKTIGETLLQLVEGEEPELLRIINDSANSIEDVKKRLSISKTGVNSSAKILVATDTVKSTGEIWSHLISLQLYSVKDILNIQQPQGLDDFIDSCLYRLLIKNRDHPYFRHDLKIADMELDMIPQAFELFEEIPFKKRQVLSLSFAANLPSVYEPAGQSEFLNAYEFGWNSQLKEAVLWNLLNNSLQNNALYNNDWGEFDEFLYRFSQKLNDLYDWHELEESGQEFHPEKEMESIAELYNQLTLYRQLVFVKNRIFDAIYYAENYDGILSFKQLFLEQ